MSDRCGKIYATVDAEGDAGAVGVEPTRCVVHVTVTVPREA